MTYRPYLTYAINHEPDRAPTDRNSRDLSSLFNLHFFNSIGSRTLQVLDFWQRDIDGERVLYNVQNILGAERVLFREIASLHLEHGFRSLLRH